MANRDGLLRDVCQAFASNFSRLGGHFERILFRHTFDLYCDGESLMPIIDNAHLMQSLALAINEEFRSRITYSRLLPRLARGKTQVYLLKELFY